MVLLFCGVGCLYEDVLFVLCCLWNVCVSVSCLCWSVLDVFDYL